MIHRATHLQISRLALCGFALALAGCAAEVSKTPPPQAPVPAITPVPPAVPIPPAPPPGEPTAFINMSADTLRAKLGSPQFVRPDGATQMWRYDSTSCRVFFFLYGSAPTATVHHVETLPAGPTSAADPACLSALQAAAKR